MKHLKQYWLQREKKNFAAVSPQLRHGFAVVSPRFRRGFATGLVTWGL
jgi:hypothetical protein